MSFEIYSQIYKPDFDHYDTKYKYHKELENKVILYKN
jgi:hypothetical protein